MTAMDESSWATSLANALSADLQESWGGILCRELVGNVSEAMLGVFSADLAKGPALEMATWATEQVGQALQMQFKEGLPPEALEDLALSVQNLLQQELEAGQSELLAREAVTQSAREAVEEWASGVAEELANEFLEVLRTSGGARPQAMVDYGKRAAPRQPRKTKISRTKKPAHKVKPVVKRRPKRRTPSSRKVRRPGKQGTRKPALKRSRGMVRRTRPRSRR